MISSICDSLSNYNLTENVLINSNRHLKESTKKNVFSASNYLSGNAKGHWYEALLYEIILELIIENELVKGIVRKGNDATCKKHNSKITQNGFFYNKSGDTLIRSGGIDLAEIDIMLIDNDSSFSFVEVTNSKQNLGEFDKEIEYKKSLIRELNNQKNVPFLLISSEDVSHNMVVQDILRCSDNYYVHFNPYKDNKIFNFVHQKSNLIVVNNYPKLVCLNDITIKNNFDYYKRHEKLKNELFRAIGNKESIEKRKIILNPPTFVTKVLMGSLYPNAVKQLFQNITIDDEKFTAGKAIKQFSKVVLAIGLPELRPVFYLKLRKKHEYIKIGPTSINNFNTERIISHFSNGFIEWLDNTNVNLGYNISKQIIDFYITDEVTNSKRYRGTPKMSKIIND